jgi:Glucodextranase, domain B
MISWGKKAIGLLLLVAMTSGVIGCGSSTTTTTTTSAADGTVSVTVSSPTSGTVMASSNVTVRGTVDPPNATVQVQGKPAAVGNGVFTGSAELHSGKTTIDVIGSAQGDAPGSTSVAITRETGGSSSHGGGSSGGSSNSATPSVAHESPSETSSGQTPCGGSLSVGPHTTCAFAENVRSQYEADGPGTVEVYSPVTEKTYAMSCSSGSPVICTGGNDASVYFP